MNCSRKRRVPLQHLDELAPSTHSTHPPSDDSPLRAPESDTSCLVSLLNHRQYPFLASSVWGLDAPNVTVLGKRRTSSFGLAFDVYDNGRGRSTLCVAGNTEDQTTQFLSIIYASTTLRGHDSAIVLRTARRTEHWLFLTFEPLPPDMIGIMARGLQRSEQYEMSLRWSKQLLSVAR